MHSPSPNLFYVRKVVCKGILLDSGPAGLLFGQGPLHPTACHPVWSPVVVAKTR